MLLNWDDLSPNAQEKLEAAGFTEEKFNEIGELHQRDLMHELPWSELPSGHRETFVAAFGKEAEAEWEANRTEKQSIYFCHDLEPRVITTTDLYAIMDIADELDLNRQLDPSIKTWLDPEGVHVFKPYMVHCHAMLKVADPHMRGFVYLKPLHQDKPEQGFLDVPMELFNELRTSTDYRYDVGLPTGDDSWDAFVREFWRVIGEGEVG